MSRARDGRTPIELPQFVEDALRKWLQHPGIFRFTPEHVDYAKVLQVYAWQKMLRIDVEDMAVLSISKAHEQPMLVVHREDCERLLRDRTALLRE